MFLFYLIWIRYVRFGKENVEFEASIESYVVPHYDCMIGRQLSFTKPGTNRIIFD